MFVERGPDGQDSQHTVQLERLRIARELTTAVAGVPPAEIPDALCRACVNLLPEVSGLSASLALPEVNTSILLFASDEVAALLAEAQFTLGEGPCEQALRLGHPVLASNLTRGPQSRRWLLFAAQAAKVGVEGVVSLPLTDSAGPLGTLDLYRETAGGAGTGLLRTALLVAEALTVTIGTLGHPSGNPYGAAAWLEGAHDDRKQIHLASGMIMAQLGVAPHEAMLRLRARAFAQDQTCTAVAREIVNRTVDLAHD
jgi:hypothetical protein